jgi:hypothetical protein
MTLSTFNHLDFLGHALIYQKSTVVHPLGDGKYYYLDKRIQMEHGPFGSIHEAILNWQLVYLHSPNLPPFPAPNANPAAIEEIVNNVIRVDFVNKKRIG